ncbi:MAG: hypothetical protein LBB53_03980 [Prevotellaceae bacterium]|jgi:regulator of replication initiation timing|nr:hypothetical protein [Prevotellaceae bacterium]
MNLDFYIYGTPNGYNQYPADEKSRLFQDFARNCKTDSQLTIHRDGQLVYYAYQRRIAADSANSFLGFCLVFNGSYCCNTQKLFDLFDRAYNDVMLKGEFLRFDKNGKVSFTVEKFTDKELEIERIKKLFDLNINSEFGKDFAPVSPSFKVGSGAKTLSIKDDKADIDAAMRNFDSVYVANNEKSVSELERVYRMYAKLETEKQNLTVQYNKLLGQKKQYKAVLFLCLIVIGCTIGLFVFNSSLKSRDSQISNLNSQVQQQQTKIENINSDIADLQVKNSTLTSENSKLQSVLQTITSERDNLSSENKQLNYTISDKNSTISNLQSENSKLRSKNSSLTSDIDYWKNKSSSSSSCYTVYTINVSKSYCYRQCAGTYYNNDCYYSSGATVWVYAVVDGYGLTKGGYIKMSDLKKD